MRKTYQSIDDFLNDSSFKEWVLEGKHHHQWHEWTLSKDESTELMQSARLYLLAMKVDEQEIQKADIQEALGYTWEKINEQERINKENFWLRLFKSSTLQKVAAILLVGICLVWVYQQQITPRKELGYEQLISQQNDGLIEQANNTDKPQLITLSDGSSVLLQPNSKLSYPKTFIGNERKVYLLGEAFFEISKNPAKPFFVFANELVTKVLGTSFRIKAYKDNPNVDVVVRTGKVSISSNTNVQASDKPIVLLPNQSIRFQRKELTFDQIITINNNKPDAANQVETIEQVNFEFADVAVSQIFTTLKQVYLIEIDYPQEKLKDCYLTTSLSDQPLPEKLKIICESLGNNTRYEMHGNQIIIHSNGCN